MASHHKKKKFCTLVLLFFAAIKPMQSPTIIISSIEILTDRPCPLPIFEKIIEFNFYQTFNKRLFWSMLLISCHIDENIFPSHELI